MRRGSTDGRVPRGRAARCARTPAPALADPQRGSSTAAGGPGRVPRSGLPRVHAAGRTFICGGTLSATGTSSPPPTARRRRQRATAPAAFTVTWASRQGQLDARDQFSVADNDVNDRYDASGFNNDVGVLTLSTPAPPRSSRCRSSRSDETSLWQAGATADDHRLGQDRAGTLSRRPARGDRRRCGPTPFCAAPGAGLPRRDHGVRRRGESTDTCEGDSGGPLMVATALPDPRRGPSWGALDCGRPGLPGSTRASARRRSTAGSASACRWRERGSTPRRSRASRSRSRSARTHPTDPGVFTNFVWDFDSDGTPDERARPSRTPTPPGEPVRRARTGATGSRPRRGDAKVAVGVADSPATPAGAAAPAARPSRRRPRAPEPRDDPRLGRPKVTPRALQPAHQLRRHRAARHRRDRGLPPHPQDRHRQAAVRRGGSRRVSVKLTKTGRRLLRRSETKRLRVKVQVRVGRRVLRSKGLTIRR